MSHGSDYWRFGLAQGLISEVALYMYLHDTDLLFFKHYFLNFYLNKVLAHYNDVKFKKIWHTEWVFQYPKIISNVSFIKFLLLKLKSN